MSLNYKRWSTFVAFCILITISSILMLGMIDNGHGWGDDFASYLMQAKSIAAGNPNGFIAANAYTIQNSYKTLGPIAYPWGYPLLLAPIFLIFGLKLISLKLIGIFSYQLFILLLYIAYVRVRPNFWMWLYLGLFAFNPVMLISSTLLHSDIPFLFFSTLSIVLIDNLYGNKRDVNSSNLSILIAIGLSIVCAAMIRTNGLLLIPTLIAAQVIFLYRLPKKLKVSINFSQLYIALPYAIFTFFYLAIGKILPQGDQSHLSELQNISLPQIWENMRYNFFLISEFFAIPGGNLVYLATIPPFILGLRYNFQRHYSLTIYLILTLILYTIWPFRQGIRFFFPILPIYFLFVVYGLEIFNNTLSKFSKNNLLKALIYIPLVVINFYFFNSSYELAKQIQASKERVLHGPFSEMAIEMYSFIKENTSIEDVIIFRKPRAMRLMSERNSIVLNDITSVKNGQYIVLDKDEESIKLSNDLQTQKRSVKKLFHNSEFEIYLVE